MFRKTRKKANRSMFSRMVRAAMAVVILTAFVLSISFFVKEVSKMDSTKIVRAASPLLEKVGISPQIAGQVVGQVAGTLSERVFKNTISPSKSYEKENAVYRPESLESVNNSNIASGQPESVVESEQENIVLKVAFLSDSHNENTRLKEALDLAKVKGVHTVFFLGDYTDFGEEEKLVAAKKVMDDSDVAYYSLPGDHDLAASIGPKNYNKVFGEPLQSVTIGDSKSKFVILDNSANFTLIDNNKIEGFKNELAGADFVLLSQPLYHPLASKIKPVMGYDYKEGIEVPEVKSQADEILKSIRDSDALAVIAGDQHSYGVEKDPIRDTLSHIYVGSIIKDTPSLGRSSITFVNIYEDGNFSVEEMPF